MIIYTDRLIPADQDAMTLGPVILIRPRCRGDVGLLEHERVHVRQWKQSFGLFWPRYLLSKKWRLRYEVEAYRKQLEFSPGRELLFASYLADKYRAGITVAQALEMLK